MKFILVLIFAGGLPAYAVPTLYPETFNFHLRNTTSSNVVADSKDPARFYVLPPIRSTATVTNLHTVTANAGFCREIADLQRYNADTIRLLNSLKDKRGEAQKKLEAETIVLQYAVKSYDQFILKYVDGGLDRIFREMRRTRVRLLALNEDLKKCVRDCGDVSIAIEAEKLRLGELSLQRSIKSQNWPQGAEWESHASMLEKAEQTVSTYQVNLHDMQEDLRELYADFNRMFDAHAQREGARVAITYNSRWSENVVQLASQNPGLRFEKIPTRNAVLKAGAYARSSLLPGGSVLSFDVAGMNAGSQLLLESFPESFSGNAVLNLLAVCPLLHPDWFDVPAGTSGKMNYPLTVSYEYPAAMTYEVTATYNMHRMYELIKTQGTSGGFFSSRSWSHQEEQNFFKDAFRVDWKFQDDKKLFSEERKLEINSDILRQIMSRLAGNLVLNDNGTKLAAPGDPPQTGALVLSNSLRKNCPFNMQCQGASIILNVMQSIFGSSSTMQNLKRVTNVTMTDIYRSEQVVMQPMLSSFH